MFEDKTVAVVVPAYNEEKLIGRVITTMPDFVDRIIVVNDGSKDGTGIILDDFAKSNIKIVLVKHEQNQGLGQSLIDGYLKSLELGMAITAVMAGDAQMDPADLPNVIKPVASGKAGYVKGNRLLSDEPQFKMPWFRFFGNSVLTLLTKFATGYWQFIDPQCGYTAISHKALSAINIKEMIKGYGYNAHILYMLNLINCKVKDVEVRPVYGKEKSKIKIGSYVFKVGFLLSNLYCKRMFHKYLVREFHPLIFFYLFSFVNIVLLALPLLIRLIYMHVQIGEFPSTTLILFSLAATMGLFSFFFGMWLDMDDNRRLAVRDDD